MLFKDKAVIVTGGATGIGRAAAFAFAREGAKVVLADINDVEGEATAEQIRGSMKTEALFVRTDVLRRADVAAMVDTTVDRFGRLDCAFNNAGVARRLRSPVGVNYDGR